MRKIIFGLAMIGLLSGCDSCDRKPAAPTVINQSEGSVTSSQTPKEPTNLDSELPSETSPILDLTAETTTSPDVQDGGTATGIGTATGTSAKKAHKFESQDLKIGSGATAKEGNSITIHYVGTFENGIKFDSSVDRESPLSFTLGKGEQIKGWDQGIKGMKVGGKRRLVVPPELGYGSTGVKGVIPPDSTLFFDIELLSVK